MKPEEKITPGKLYTVFKKQAEQVTPMRATTNIGDLITYWGAKTGDSLKSRITVEYDGTKHIGYLYSKLDLTTIWLIKRPTNKHLDSPNLTEPMHVTEEGLLVYQLPNKDRFALIRRDRPYRPPKFHRMDTLWVGGMKSNGEPSDSWGGGHMMMAYDEKSKGLDSEALWNAYIGHVSKLRAAPIEGQGVSDVPSERPESFFKENRGRLEQWLHTATATAGVMLACLYDVFDKQSVEESNNMHVGG